MEKNCFIEEDAVLTGNCILGDDSAASGTVQDYTLKWMPSGVTTR